MRESIGAYRLLERTGDDTLGDVYRARDTERGRTAAVRLVHPAIALDAPSRAALVADAQRAAALSHPSLAALFDVVDEGDDLALAHEHVDGKTLAATLGGTPLNPRLASAIGIQIADGLAELHAAGLTHGAVDAEHIVINPRGQAKLIDAGLVPWLAADATNGTGKRGRGSASVDDAARADVASLGRLLASMTGASLPKATWSDDLRSVIDRARPDHPRRFEAVATMAAELRAVAAMLEARADAAPPPSPSGASVIVWLMIAAALLAVGAWFLFG